MEIQGRTGRHSRVRSTYPDEDFGVKAGHLERSTETSAYNDRNMA